MAEPAQAMTIQSFVDAIASKANIDQAAAEKLRSERFCLPYNRREMPLRWVSFLDTRCG